MQTPTLIFPRAPQIQPAVAERSFIAPGALAAYDSTDGIRVIDSDWKYAASLSLDPCD